MPFTLEARDMALAYITGMISHASLHSGRPTIKGTELSDGAYARQKVEIFPPEGGETTTEHSVRVEVPPETDVSYVGFWTAQVGGTLLAFARVPKKRFKGRGVIEITAASFDFNLGADDE